jgi:putative ABC transport system substrate-binding protein
VEAGGPLAFATDPTENCRHAATNVDNIRKGAEPGDLPIDQVTRIELVVNMKTSNTLRIAIPASIFARGQGDRMSGANGRFQERAMTASGR